MLIRVLNEQLDSVLQIYGHVVIIKNSINKRFMSLNYSRGYYELKRNDKIEDFRSPSEINRFDESTNDL